MGHPDINSKPSPPSANGGSAAPQRPDHHGSATPGKKKPGPLRWILRSLLVIALLLVLLFALLPTLVSTGPGTRWVVSLIEPRIGGELDIDDLSLSWFSGQQASGIVFKRTDGSLYIEIGDLHAKEASLFSLATGGRGVGLVEVVDLFAVYDKTPPVPSDTQQPDPAPGSTSDPAPSQPRNPRDDASTTDGPWKGLAFDLVVRGADVRYRAADMAEVTLTAPTAQLQVIDGKDVAWSTEGTVQQGDRVGSFVSKGQGQDMISAEGLLQPAAATYDVTASASDLPVQGLTRLLGEQRWKNPAVAYLVGARGRLAAVLGGETLSTSLSLDGKLNEIDADLTVSTQNLVINFPLRRDGNRLIVSPDSELRWVLTPEAFTALFAKSGLTLQGPVRFAARTIEADLPSDGRGIDLDAASLSVVLASDDAAMTDPAGRNIRVEGMRIGVTSDSLAELVAGRLEATVTAPDETGEMVAGALQADLAGRQLFTPTRELSFISEKLPIALIDALGGFEDDLVVWLGATLDMDIMVQGRVEETEARPQVVYDFSLAPESSRISGELPGEKNGSRWTAQTPEQEPIEIVLRAESFARLMSLISGNRDKPVLRLAGDQSMIAYVTINQTSYAPKPGAAKVSGAMMVDPELVYTDLTIELTPARVMDPRNDKIYELRSGTFKAVVADGQLDGSLDVNLWVPPDAGKAGFGAALTMQTQIFDLIDTTGKLPLTGSGLAEQIRLQGGIGLTDTPSDLFDSILQREGDLAAVLGPVVDDLDVRFSMDGGKPTGASIRLNWDETVNAPIDGAWASMRPLELDIDPQGMMTIKDGQDVTLELRVHPELGDRWMGQLHPILFDAKSGDRPVQIRIDGKSFRFPLGAEGMQGSNVEAMVDLGSLEFGTDSLLGRLLSWTGHAGDRAVFNPARVALTDGIISYEQLDLSVGNVQIRFDGRLDLNSGEIVEMAMRVPGSSLIRVFSELEGVVPADDFLSIPMSGSLRDPQFDRQLITREVARLFAENALRRQRGRFEDRVREGIGLPPRRPVAQPEADQPGAGPPQPDEPQPVQEQLRDQAIDLIFGRRSRGTRDD